MDAIIALIITFLVGLALKVKGFSQNRSLALASLLMPSFFLIKGGISIYSGKASMWPIALIFGTIIGVIVSGLGIVAGAYISQWMFRPPNNTK